MSAEWVVSDAMGVVYEVGDDTNDLLVPYVQELNPLISREKINEVYLTASLGRISSRQFWRDLGFGDRYPRIEEDYLTTCLRLDPGFKGTAEKLLRSYSLAMLSNDVAEWSVYLRAMFDLDKYFNAVIISGDVGYRKPGREIFDIFLGKVKAPASNCVFVDDSAKNLRAAAELGFRTVKFLRGGLSGDSQADWAVRSFAELPDAVDIVFERNMRKGERS